MYHHVFCADEKLLIILAKLLFSDLILYRSQGKELLLYIFYTFRRNITKYILRYCQA